MTTNENSAPAGTGYGPASYPPPPYPYPPRPPLQRSRFDRMLGGVCAGLGRSLGVDPTVVRLVAVLALVLSAGTALLAYLVAWVVVPEEPAIAWNPAQPEPGTAASAHATPPAA